MPMPSDKTIDKQDRMSDQPQEVRNWAEKREGYPLMRVGDVERPEQTVRLAFEDEQVDSGYKRITWDEFANKFVEEKLAFVYRNKNDDGEVSRYYHFAPRESFINQQDTSPEDVDYSDNVKRYLVE